MVPRFTPRAAQRFSRHTQKKYNSNIFECRTFIYSDDVWVAECGHDLNFSANVNQILLILDLLLSDRLYGNLKKKKKRKRIYMTFGEKNSAVSKKLKALINKMTQLKR